jgi:hypothetical protein
MRRGRRVSTVCLVLALFASFGATSSEAAEPGSISGRVVDATTKLGISNIYVCLDRGFLGPPGGCTFTDWDGDYALVGVEPGKYGVDFRDESASTNYLDTTYDADPAEEGIQWVTVGPGATLTGIDGEMETGGQIAGTVTDAITGEGVEGVHVCARPTHEYEGVIRCDRSDEAGDYTINSLWTDSYAVEFFVESRPNYITQYFDGKSRAFEADPVAVTAGATPIDGVDAAMSPGIQITGTVTEAGSGSPVGWVGICARHSGSGVVQQCAGTEFDGTYSIAGLPLGSYVVAFAVDNKEDGYVLHPDGYVRQYFDHKALFTEATVLGGPAPGTYTGVDATLSKGPEIWPEEVGGATPAFGSPGPYAFTPPRVRPGRKPPQRRRPRCRSGFHRKKLKGKLRCVRKGKKREPLTWTYSAPPRRR